MKVVHDAATGENSLFEQLDAIELLPGVKGAIVVAICELVGGVMGGTDVDEVAEIDEVLEADNDCAGDTLILKNNRVEVPVVVGNDEVELLMDAETDDVELSFKVIVDIEEVREDEGIDDGDTLRADDEVEGIKIFDDVGALVDDAALADVDALEDVDEVGNAGKDDDANKLEDTDEVNDDNDDDGNVNDINVLEEVNKIKLIALGVLNELDGNTIDTCA